MILINLEIVPMTGVQGFIPFVFCVFISRLNSFAAFCDSSICIDKAPSLSCADTKSL